MNALAGQVIGRSLDVIEDLAAGLWGHVRHGVGTKGVGVTAASALETACWDLLGKSTGRPVSAILGCERDRVPAHLEGAVWFEASIDQLRVEAEKWVAARILGHEDAGRAPRAR